MRVEWTATLMLWATIVGCASPQRTITGDGPNPASADAASLPLPPSSAVLSVAEDVAGGPASSMAEDETGHHNAHNAHTQPAPSPTTSPADDQGHRHEPVDPAGAYVCPMHPDVRSDQPGRCPKCNMQLVPVKPSEGQ